MTYHVRGFMAFGPNDQCYAPNHVIVCDNVPILCTHMYHGMENNVAGESFPFRRTENPFSIFRAQKTGRFVKQPPNYSFRMLPPHFVKILYHITCTIPQSGYLKPFRSSLAKKINSCRIGRKWVRFELQVHDPMLMFFGKKYFFDSQYAISSEIQCKFSKAQPLAKKLYDRRFNRSLKR